MALRIERAAEQDIPAIVRLVRRLAEYEKLAHAMVSSDDDFRKALFGPQRNVEALMAFADDAPVGFALYFYNFSTFLGKRGIYLEDLFVEPEYRGQGIGKALLQRLARIGIGLTLVRPIRACLIVLPGTVPASSSCTLSPARRASAAKVNAATDVPATYKSQTASGWGL